MFCNMAQVTFIIHTTYSCNANCLHCGVKGLNYGKQVLDIDAGVKAIKACIDFLKTEKQRIVNEIVLIFHGGEPFLPGVIYYEKFLNKLYKSFSGFKFEISFQTNLTLYSQEWKNFLQHYKGKISTSYDFFADFRVFNRNSSTEDYYKTWIDRVKQYQDDFGGRVHVITVVNQLNKNHIKEIINLSYTLGLNLKLNPLYCAGNAKNIYNECAINAIEYGQILIDAYKAYKKYHQEDKTFIVEQCKEMEDFVLGKDDKMFTKCPYAGNCVGFIFGIAPNGDIYNCGDDIQLGGKFYLGNADKGIDKDKYLNALVQDALIPEECYQCGICGGGCKLFRNNGKIIWCESYKMLYHHIKKTALSSTKEIK